jgi:hypothetical protein
MKWFSFGSKLTALCASLLLVGALGGTALAYPPPTGSVSMSLSNTTPTTGSTVSISATVINQAGAAVQGIECTFAIISQPGTGATVEAGPKLTNYGGVATTTLTTGDAAGTVVVGANCGEMSSQVLVQTTAAAPSAGAATLRVPPTGTGPGDTTPIGLFLTVLMVGGIACLAGGQTLRIVSKRARGS